MSLLAVSLQTARLAGQMQALVVLLAESVTGLIVAIVFGLLGHEWATAVGLAMVAQAVLAVVALCVIERQRTNTVLAELARLDQQDGGESTWPSADDAAETG